MALFTVAVFELLLTKFRFEDGRSLLKVLLIRQMGRKDGLILDE